eukprot:UN00800
MMPILFSILNLLCGIFLIIISFYNDFCSWFRILFGVCIAWVAITSQICDQWALVWFPLWNKSFGFMGCSYIFLACGGYAWLVHDGSSWNGFFYFFIWAVGIAYVVIYIMSLLNCCGCPLPVPLLECGGGGGSNDNEKDSGQTSKA